MFVRLLREKDHSLPSGYVLLMSLFRIVSVILSPLSFCANAAGLANFPHFRQNFLPIPVEILPWVDFATVGGGVVFLLGTSSTARRVQVCRASGEAQCCRNVLISICMSGFVFLD